MEAGISSSIRKNRRKNGIDSKNRPAILRFGGKVYEAFNPAQLELTT
jgi:cytoplasmic iron level regulating protein YaaA (DUF328/UPF0246 family)